MCSMYMQYARRFVDVQDMLETRYGRGTPVPCGVTAEAVEGDLEFVNGDFPVQGGVAGDGKVLYRLHFEIDADNISDDHVVFLVKAGHQWISMHSYAQFHPAIISVHDDEWLDAIARMVATQDPQQWIHLFRLNPDRVEFVAPVTISHHVSRAILL